MSFFKDLQCYRQEESRFLQDCLIIEEYAGPIDQKILFYLLDGSKVCKREHLLMYTKLLINMKGTKIPIDDITFRSYQILFLYECSQKEIEFSMYENALKILWSYITDPLLTKVEFVRRFYGIEVFFVPKILSAWDWYRTLIRRDEKGPEKCPKILEQLSRYASRGICENPDLVLDVLWMSTDEPITKDEFMSICPQEKFAGVDYEESWNWYCGLVRCPGKNPRSLKHLSRCAIIHKLKECSQLPDGVDQLNLPERLKKYILLIDLKEIN